jgi:hypothetical protein
MRRVVATVVADQPFTSDIERSAIEFLGSRTILRWAAPTRDSTHDPGPRLDPAGIGCRRLIDMKAAVVVFPGSNRERDMAHALKLVSGREPAMVWHAESELPAGTDLVVLPAGSPMATICAAARLRRAPR